MDIKIDKNNMITQNNKLYRGLGMVSGNNSSRLLLDYKALHEDKYWEILNLMFSQEYLNINHIKIEIGSDVNSSSGTEPNPQRYEDEPCDVTRGAGFQLLADAKKINPNITIDMLYWSEPRWTCDSENKYEKRYKWFKSILDKAYETYGLKFDYVSGSRNEREIESEFIKFLSKALKNEKNCPYDYSKIKIVGADEEGSWWIADRMLDDTELLDAVDVLGSHYISTSTEKAQKLCNEHNKELWLSEGCPPMTYSKGTCRFEKSLGMNDINGILDIANRIISSYPQGLMTLYEFQPVVSAYYDGVTYCQKQLIMANEPWSGYYYVDAGFYMALHFSKFFKKGWCFVDGACFADGKKGGDGHAIVDANHTFFTAVNPETDDFSTILTNTTDKEITYNFKLSNLKTSSNPVYVWETRGSKSEMWNENYFKKISTIYPENSKFSVTLKPYSLVTISTLDVKEISFEEKSSQPMNLPYEDDFEYMAFGENFLSSRGFSPLFTTDQGGAFEVVKLNGKNILAQKITPETKADEWGYTPNPVTSLGDDRWYNYTVSIDVLLAKIKKSDEVYAGVGLRYLHAPNGNGGYWLKLFENGEINLMKQNQILKTTTLENFAPNVWHNLKLSAQDEIITAFFDEEKLFEFNAFSEKSPLLGGGRVGIFSSFDENYFANLKIFPIENSVTSVIRVDNTDRNFDYFGDWTHETTAGFVNFRRTISRGENNAMVTFEFFGNGFGFFGETTDSTIISVKIDNEVLFEQIDVSNVGCRDRILTVKDLENSSHKVEVKVLNGKLSLDGGEYTTIKN